jgi:hypothetical protein
MANPGPTQPASNSWQRNLIFIPHLEANLLLLDNSVAHGGVLIPLDGSPVRPVNADQIHHLIILQERERAGQRAACVVERLFVRLDLKWSVDRAQLQAVRECAICFDHSALYSPQRSSSINSSRLIAPPPIAQGNAAFQGHVASLHTDHQSSVRTLDVVSLIIAEACFRHKARLRLMRDRMLTCLMTSEWHRHQTHRMQLQSHKAQETIIRCVLRSSPKRVRSLIFPMRCLCLQGQSSMQRPWASQGFGPTVTSMFRSAIVITKCVRHSCEAQPGWEYNGNIVDSPTVGQRSRSHVTQVITL